MRFAPLVGPELRELLREDPEQVRELLEEIHDEDLADLIADLPDEEAAELLARLPTEEAAPIFERLDDERQAAIVTELGPESTAQIAVEMSSDERADLIKELPEDVQRLAGVEPLEASYFQTTFWTFIRKRANWLIILFVGEFFTGSALRHYDSIIQTVAKLSYYVPLLISTGGNSGSQSASLIIRGLAVGEVKPSDWWRIAGRELAQGIVLGLILAIVGMIRVTMWGDGTRFALLVGGTLVSIVVMGCVVGSMLPLALRRIGFDPATSSTPFISSLVDVLGIIIYFNIARLILTEVVHSSVVHP